MIKLHPIDKYNIECLDNNYTICFDKIVALKDESAIVLAYENIDVTVNNFIKTKRNFYLLKFMNGEIEKIPLDFIHNSKRLAGYDVVIVQIKDYVGIIANNKCLYLYKDFKEQPIKIDIPSLKSYELKYKLDKCRNFEITGIGPITDNNILPLLLHIGFTVDSNKNWIAYLNVDIDNKSSRWLSVVMLKKSQISHGYNSFSIREETPEMYHSAFFNNNIYTYLIGDRFNREYYGMDYYKIIIIDNNGDLIETIYDTGDLRKNEHEKCQCVFGRFLSDKENLLFTPKLIHPLWGKTQKIFNIKSKQVINLTFKRGYFKTQLIDSNGNIFWGYIESKKEIISFKEEV